jgi:hypothetical protein
MKSPMCGDDQVRARLTAALVAGVATLAGSGCLPDDTRPIPAEVDIQVQPSDSFIDTDDGWHISLSRLLIGIGALELEGPDCIHYNQSRYTRLFELTLPEIYGQPVGLIYGLGRCDLGFDLRTPESNSLLGEEATEDDITEMRAAADDAWVSEPEPTSVYVRGEATSGGTSKSFEWRFRKQYELKQCPGVGEGFSGTSLTLYSEDRFTRFITISMASLFRDGEEGEAPLTFAEMAAADADLDDRITLEELETVPAPSTGGGGPPGGPEPESPSLADRLYDERVPGMARLFGSGPCEVEID